MNNMSNMKMREKTFLINHNGRNLQIQSSERCSSNDNFHVCWRQVASGDSVSKKSISLRDLLNDLLDVDLIDVPDIALLTLLLFQANDVEHIAKGLLQRVAIYIHVLEFHSWYYGIEHLTL